MNRFMRLRSDGALSIDLDDATDAAPVLSVFNRDGGSSAGPLATAVRRSMTPHKSDAWFGNVSSTTGDSSSPVPRRPSPVKEVEFDMKARLAQEEEWNALQECTFHPVIGARSRHLAAASSSSPKPESRLWNSPRRGTSPKRVFDKLFADAKTQQVQRAQLRADRWVEEQERRKEVEGHGLVGDISPTRRRRGSGAIIDGEDADEGVAGVFNRLYGDAQRLRQKQDELLRKREENLREEENRVTMPSPQRRHRKGEGSPRLTAADRKELFARLSMPVRKAEKKELTPTGHTASTKEGEDSRRYALQWPVPSMHTLTLADLRRHNDLAGGVSVSARLAF